LIGVKHSRFNCGVVLLLLAAFLLVQADLPISQAVAIRPPAAHQCGCSLEMQAHGACCCCSMGLRPKSGCSLRASRCGENGSNSDTVIVVKFHIVLPVLAVVFLHDVVRKTALPSAIDASMRSTEPPVPPPRLLIPA
jgi:hypothetical protein